MWLSRYPAGVAVALSLRSQTELISDELGALVEHPPEIVACGPPTNRMRVFVARPVHLDFHASSAHLPADCKTRSPQMVFRRDVCAYWAVLSWMRIGRTIAFAGTPNLTRISRCSFASAGTVTPRAASATYEASRISCVSTIRGA